jgi:hypothetical protein
VFSGMKVGDDPVSKWTNGLDILVRFAMHLLGLLTDGNDFAGIAIQGNDGRFINHDGVPMDYQGVGGAKVNGNFLGK